MFPCKFSGECVGCMCCKGKAAPESGRPVRELYPLGIPAMGGRREDAVFSQKREKRLGRRRGHGSCAEGAG